MKPKFIQINCTEGNKIDLRQSRAVLKYKPDLIFLEYSTNYLKPITRPSRISKEVIKKYPWTESDNFMWDNIAGLWKKKYKTLVFPVDGPHDLLIDAYVYPCNEKQPRKTTNLFWWTRIYLRECFMTKNISKASGQYKQKQKPVILIFLQSFHWYDVKFLLSKPSKQKIWDFYFGRFKKLNRRDMPAILKKENKILFKYWSSSINSLWP